jgi:signal transduction histidine kinase
VRDTGIVLEDIAKALQPFGQINSDLNRKYIGTGLGLPLATELAEMHGGTLVLCGEPGVSTTIAGRFPSERIVQMIHGETVPPASVGLLE